MYSEKNFQKVCRCPLCDSNKKSFMYMSESGGGDDHFNEFTEEVPIVKCDGCGLIYSEYVLTEREKKRFFALYSSKVHEDSKETINKRQAMYQLEFDYIAQYLDFSKAAKVLDVGCAEGKFLDFFRKKDWNAMELRLGRKQQP